MIKHFKLSSRGKLRLKPKYSSSRPKREGDPVYYPPMRACESICPPDEIDICMLHYGSCKERYL